MVYLAMVGTDGTVTVNRIQIENNDLGAFISAATATLTNNNLTINTG